jgi:hypothetical protein
LHNPKFGGNLTNLARTTGEGFPAKRAHQIPHLLCEDCGQAGGVSAFKRCIEILCGKFAG